MVARADAGRPTTILVRSGWQTVNIGDIAHTPALLRLLGQRLPQAEFILWHKRALDRGVEAMLRGAFPNLRIANAPGDLTLEAAFAKADFLVHGSGPSIDIALLDQWSRATQKPYGTFGNTFGQPVGPDAQRVLSEASFVFARETASRDRLREAAVSTPHLQFAPDAVFAFDLTNDAAAETFLKQNNLRPGEFICVIPRLRKTPYHKIYPDRERSERQITEVDSLNARWAEVDHAKAREAMVRWVRETGHKVLVCPEMTYQLDIMDELLIDPLPDDVRTHVVKRDTYWLPDEAASVYRRARVVVSFECHSPIIAFAQGTPAFYLRQPQDSAKGQMWYDIGVPQWVFEIEETCGADIADRLMAVHNDYQRAGQTLSAAMKFVHERQTASLDIVAAAIANSGKAKRATGR